MCPHHVLLAAVYVKIMSRTFAEKARTDRQPYRPQRSHLQPPLNKTLITDAFDQTILLSEVSVHTPFGGTGFYHKV